MLFFELVGSGCSFNQSSSHVYTTSLVNTKVGEEAHLVPGLETNFLPNGSPCQNIVWSVDLQLGTIKGNLRQAVLELSGSSKQNTALTSDYLSMNDDIILVVCTDVGRQEI